MFENTLITVGPNVTVGTVAEGTLVNMFKDCPNLKEVILEIGSLAPNVTPEQAMGGVLGGTTGTKAEGGELNIIWLAAPENGGSTETDTDATPLTLDDMINASGLSTEVLDNTKVAVTDGNGNTSEPTKFMAATGVKMTVTHDGIPLESIELTVGQEYNIHINAQVTPVWATDKRVVVSIIDKSIAKQSYIITKQGITSFIKAFSPGTTYLRVTHGDYSAQIKVTVKEAPVAVESITLNETSVDLVTGVTVTLKATVKPDNATDPAVSWSSSDDKVATVKDGVVTATGAGEATITAKAGGKTAECKVTVKAATVAVTGVTLNKTSLDMKVGDSETLTATVAPTEATNKAVTWKSSKESVATVDSEGKVTAVAAGEATITVTTTDGEKTAECKVTVKAVPITSISDPDNYSNGGSNPF